MKRHSWLPLGGINVFQEVKAMCQAEIDKGKTLYRLSIGQPKGAALPSARMRASELVLGEEECWHEYQDNGFMPFPDWAKRFVAAHAGVSGEVDYMPTPGTKPMLKHLIVACGIRSQLAKVYTMTEPGYAVPATWCGSGFVAPMAAAALHALEEDRESVFAACHQYQKRTEEIVYPILTAHGMRPAVKPVAGFFSLWELPRRAFGQEITGAKQFNELMIGRTGVVGVHFEPGYIRYAVCGPVEDWVQPITRAFEQADASY